MDDLSRRTARDVLDDHLRLANEWVDAPAEQLLEDDLNRNVAKDVVVLMKSDVYRGHDGARHLARQLAEELPEHRAFTYTHISAAERLALLEWTYEDDQVIVPDGADSYLIENGKIVGQTIHYTVVSKADAPKP